MHRPVYRHCGNGGVLQAGAMYVKLAILTHRLSIAHIALFLILHGQGKSVQALTEALSHRLHDISSF